MGKKVKTVSIVILCACTIGIIGAWMFFSGRNADLGDDFGDDYPDTLPPGVMPTIYLPINNFTNISMLGPYGQVSPTYFHPGIDFVINDTTQVVAPCNAYVSRIEANFYNDIGHVYQTNLDLRLNAQWIMGISWECDAANVTFGLYQVGNISVALGDYVTTNQSLGKLLHLGPNARLHFGILYNNNWQCPYRFFNCSARALFDVQFNRVGDKNYCSCCYCCD